MAERLRIGMFGGSFDPPHRAHVALAQAALEQLKLDRLHIVPTGQAWHKTRALSAGEHRSSMCRTAFGTWPQVVIDERELAREGPSYTADSLDELGLLYPGAELFLLIGLDQLRTFRSWDRYAQVLAKATLVVAHRPGVTIDVATVVAHRTLEFIADPISSTQVRADWSAPERQALARAVVPEPVARYIAQHQLY